MDAIVYVSWVLVTT